MKIISKKFISLFLTITFAVGLLCYFWGNKTINQEMSVNSGENLKTIANNLKTNSVIRSDLSFQLLAYLMGRQNQLKVGDYLFKGRMNNFQILNKIYRGDIIVYQLRILEGWTVKKIVNHMKNQPFLTGNITQMPKEGWLLPATYQYRKGADRQMLLNKMQQEMEKTLEQIWASRSPNLEPIKTKEEFLILASMVEVETPLQREKSRVAGVFINRLKRNMRLESDPTVVYGLSKGLGDLERKLYIKDLRKDSVWNTYTRHGLPKTAIANPSLETLMAVARPEKHPYYYFVADGKGGHDFSTDYADHLEKVERYIFKKNLNN